jgi:hypothetical protein
MRDRGADEAGRAGDQNFRQNPSSQTPGTNIAGDQLTVNHRFDIGEALTNGLKAWLIGISRVHRRGE